MAVDAQVVRELEAVVESHKKQIQAQNEHIQTLERELAMWKRKTVDSQEALKALSSGLQALKNHVNKA